MQSMQVCTPHRNGNIVMFILYLLKFSYYDTLKFFKCSYYSIWTLFVISFTFSTNVFLVGPNTPTMVYGHPLLKCLPFTLLYNKGVHIP